MRKLNSEGFEIVGIGEFQEYPIKASGIKFTQVANGKEVAKKREGTGYTYHYEDAEGNRYDEQDVFYKIGNTLVQEVPRTTKVQENEFTIVDKLEFLELAETKTAMLRATETTKRNFENKIGDKALKFVKKDSTRGMEWNIAYVIKNFGKLMIVKGKGNIVKGIAEFDKILTMESQGKKAKQSIELPNDVITNEILVSLK